jgi:hypothetical protein
MFLLVVYVIFGYVKSIEYLELTPMCANLKLGLAKEYG